MGHVPRSQGSVDNGRLRRHMFVYSEIEVVRYHHVDPVAPDLMSFVRVDPVGVLEEGRDFGPCWGSEQRIIGHRGRLGEE